MTTTRYPANHIHPAPGSAFDVSPPRGAFPPEEGIPFPAGADIPVPSAGTLMLTRGPGLPVGSQFVLTAECTILGRHPEAGIVLSDVTVSRRHAEIHRHGHRYTLHDAGSLNGIYLNRQPVQRAELAPGDEISIGTYRLIFHPPGRTAPAPTTHRPADEGDDDTAAAVGAGSPPQPTRSLGRTPASGPTTWRQGRQPPTTSDTVTFVSRYERRVALVQNVLTTETTLDEQTSHTLAAHVLAALDAILEPESPITPSDKESTLPTPTR